VDLPRAQIDRVYRVSGDRSNLISKLSSGGTKGVLTTDEVLPIGDPTATAVPAALGIGAAIGALVYLIRPTESSRVLVYSR
jgi:hypothetical protein